MSLLITIKRHWGLPKWISVPLIIGLLTSITGFVWLNLDPPKVQGQLDQIQYNVQKIIDSRNAEAIEKAVQKVNIINLSKNQDKLEQNMEKGFDIINQKLDNQAVIVKTVREQTK